jgi:hypothetical protein
MLLAAYWVSTKLSQTHGMVQSVSEGAVVALSLIEAIGSISRNARRKESGDGMADQWGAFISSSV